MSSILRFLSRFLVFIFFTILTQVGGVAYLLYLLLRKTHWKKWKMLLVFSIIYLVFTFLITPPISKALGRQQVSHSEYVDCHNWFTVLLNRNYVVPEMNVLLENSGRELQRDYPELKLVYFDANFPFVNGFPLLPHLSHNDGKKIDLALIYKDSDGKPTNQKKSISGYGAFVPVNSNEENRAQTCFSQGYWQYEFSKYFSFGRINSDLELEEKATKKMIQTLLKNPQVKKLFLEPHLKQRFYLGHSKIRFHGCHSVRHDDHIHLEIN